MRILIPSAIARTGGRLNYTIALDITKYLAHEEDYVPWKAALNALNFLDAMLIKGGEYDKLKRYFLHLIDRMYKDVTFNDPPGTEMLVGYMRTDILMVACHLGHKECVQNSQHEFKKWQSEHSPDIMNPYVVTDRVYLLSVEHLNFIF